MTSTTTRYLNHVSTTPGDILGLHSYAIWYYPINNTTWWWSASWEVWDRDIVIFQPDTYLPYGIEIESLSKLVFTLSHDSLNKDYMDFTGFMPQVTSVDNLDPAVKVYVEHLTTFIQSSIPVVEIKVFTCTSYTRFEFHINELRSKKRCDEFLLLCELHTLLQQYTYSSIAWMACGGILPFADYVNRVNLNSQSVYYSMSFVEDRTVLQTQIYWPKGLSDQEFDQIDIEMQFNETLCDYMPISWPFKDYIDYSGEEAAYKTLANIEDSEVFQFFENKTYTGFQSKCKLLNNPYVFNYLLILLSHELKYISIEEINTFNLQHLRTEL